MDMMTSARKVPVKFQVSCNWDCKGSGQAVEVRIVRMDFSEGIWK